MQHRCRLIPRALAALAAATLLVTPAAAGEDLPQDALRKIEKALPARASARPAKQRRVLVFTLCRGFVHGSVPYAAEAFVRLGAATGAYEAEVSDDPRVFEKEKLDTFDAVIFDNTTGTLFDDPVLRENLLDFARGGRGVVGIHAATDCFYDWPEYGALMGGWFDGHPWNERVTIRVEDPEHPVNSAFIGRAFAVADEIYQFKAPYSRDAVRVLLSLDVNKTNMEKGGIERDDRDFPVSWVHSYGEGRVFYCSLGHRNEIFWNPTILRHYLDGIQFALGDLPADTTPSGRLARAAGQDVALVLADEWAEAAKYEEGQSRLPLTEIQSQVRAALADDARRAGVVERLLALVQDPDATFAGRAFACRQLTLIGGDEAVPALGALLRDPKLSHMARYALQRMPSDAAGAALRDALDDVEGEQLLGVLASLGERRDAAAAAIVGAGLSRYEGDARTAAIELLGKVGDEKSAEVLLGELVAAIEAGRAAEAEGVLPDAILRCADGLVAAGKTDAAAGIYGMLYYRDHARHVRLAGFCGMVRADPVDTAQDVVAMLSDEDPVWRGTAARLIREVPGTEATLAYAALAGRPPDEGRVRLIKALAERGDPAAAPAIAEQVSSALREVSEAALGALGAVGDASSVPLLTEFAVGGSEAARRTLRTMSAPGVNEAIAALMTEAEPAARIELARTLGARHARAQAPVLLAMLARRDNPIVRIAAFEALGEVAGREHLFTMVQLLALATDTNEIEVGIASVVATCLRDEDRERRAKPVVGALAHAEGAGRTTLLRVLGEIGGEAALAAVREALVTDDDTVAAAARDALAGWPDAGAAEELLAIAQGATVPALRAAAISGFARTAAMPSSRPADTTVALYRTAFELAESDELRRRALESLAHVAHPDALALAEEQLAHEAVRREAALAMIAIAGAADDMDLDTVRAVVEKACAACPDDEAVGKEAGAVIDRLEAGADYVTTWRFAGPYRKEETGGGELFDVAFPPEPGGLEGGIAWKAIPGEALVDPGIIDFMKFAGGSACCCYLETTLTSGQARRARLELGSDDGIKVWLNGEVVHANNTMRGLSLGSDVVTVNLKEGANTLLLKITQGGGDWRVSCRLRSTDGYHLPDVEASIPH